MSKAPNFAISAEQDGARAIRASEFGSKNLISLHIAGSNDTTGFGQILAGTPVGKVTATGKFRPCGKAALSTDAAGGNIASMSDASNFYVADAVDIISTLGVAGALDLVAGGGGETIAITGKNKDGLAHAFVLADPSAAGASLSKSETFSAGGVLTTEVNLATSQHALTVDADGAGGTIVVTGRDGKAHALELSDPLAAGAALGSSVSYDAAGVGTGVVSLETSQHSLSIVAEAGGGTFVVTGRDGNAHTVEIAAGGALSTSVVFNAAGVAAIVVTKSDGVSTVAEVLAELNSGTAGTIVLAALGTATGAEVAITVGSGTLAGGGAITSTVTEVLAEINKADLGEIMSAALGAAAGGETCVAVASAPLAGGGAITSTLAEVTALLNQGDTGQAVTADAGAAGATTAIAVGSSPLAGGAAVGGTIASNRTLSVVDKTSSPNTVTFSGGTVDLVQGNVIQLRDGSQTACFILDNTVSTYDESASRLAQSATYADVSSVGGFAGLYRIAQLTGYSSQMAADLGATSLVGGTYLKL